MRDAAAAAVIEAAVRSLNSRNSAVMTSVRDMLVSLRKASAPAAGRRLASLPRRLADGGVVAMVTLAPRSSADSTTMNQAVTSLAQTSGGAPSVADAVTTQLTELPSIAQAMIPGATLSSSGFLVVAPMESTSTAPAAAPSLPHGALNIPGGLVAWMGAGGGSPVRARAGCSLHEELLGDVGCDAGGVGQNCRFCGFKEYLPSNFDPTHATFPRGAKPEAVSHMCRAAGAVLPGQAVHRAAAEIPGLGGRFCGSGLYPPCLLTPQMVV
uniref:Uncharacterized protein n=1 Tax=Alexandrium monilatum TaxID=311494 RepID=A0A7S4V2L7_9DINO